jgi:iron uptake system component EfeO
VGRRRSALLGVLALAGAVALGACSNDDGSGVTNLGGSGSGSGTGSGSGSGSGLGSQLQQGSDNPLVTEAVSQYSAYVNQQTAEMATLTKVFTDAVRAGNLQAAQQAYAPSRVPWERIEPIAGLVEELDGKMDARVDDFAGVDDPAFTGWHRLEYILFAQGTTEGAAPFADQLDADVATLQQQLSTIDIPAAAVPVGASELIEEVSLGKITGEEDRYSKTDLWDLGANVDGSRQAMDYLKPALEEADPDLAGQIDTAFTELNATLTPLRQGDGWQLYCVENDEYPSDRCAGTTTITTQTKDQLAAQTAALSELTAQVAGALNLSGG